QRFLLGKDFLVVDIKTNRDVGLLEAGRVEDPLDGQLTLDGHGRRLGINTGKGDVALLVGGRGLAEAKRVNGTGQLPPLGSLGQGRVAGAVVSAVAEDKEAAEVGIAAMPFI